MKRALLFLVACGGGGGGTATPDAGPARADVGLMRPAPTRDVDVLFVIDNGPASILDKQTNLKNAFPTFINTLNEFSGGLPNLHIGVVTTDLGTSSQLDAPAPTIGGGACQGSGDNGDLQTFGSTAVTGSFISDVADVNGQRQKNYTGTLGDALSHIASAGASGCGFEQTIEAMHRALANTTTNAGFLRPDATLAVITLTDEDDHSASHAAFFDQDTSVLGPLSDFRSTHWGVTCEVGGTTPDEMNTPGMKERCSSNETSPYVVHLADEVAFLHGVKAEPRDILYAAIAGARTPVAVELQTPTGGGPQVPDLAASCSYSAGSSTESAQPPIRIAALADQLPRGEVESICQQDLAPSVTAIARSIKNLLGEQCLVRDIAMPADCEVTDDTTGAALPFTLVEDAAACPDGQHMRLDLGHPPPTWVRVRCVVP